MSYEQGERGIGLRFLTPVILTNTNTSSSMLCHCGVGVLHISYRGCHDDQHFLIFLPSVVA
jgi:hypothetical protein